MPLHVKSSDIPEAKRVQSGEAGTGSMVVRKGYGNECSLMIATRAPGYHTKPHQHESEQINYVMDGEIWFFVEDKGFQLQERRLSAHSCQHHTLGMEPFRQRCDGR